MRWIALLAAWIVVVQSMLFSLTIGAHAVHPHAVHTQVDALGNVICSTHGDDDGGRPPPATGRTAVSPAAARQPPWQVPFRTT